MSNTNSLGMDYDELKRDYVDFMNRSAEREIELTKENEKLKNDLRLCAEGLIPKDLIQRGIVEELKKENKKLKEVNENLWGSDKTLTKLMVKKIDEIKELKEENEKLKDTFTHGNIHEIAEKYQNLKEENEKLKDENELKKDAWCPELILKDLYENTNYKDPSITIKEYIQKIEAENENLKSQIPDKKGKKLSQDDKAILNCLLRVGNPEHPDHKDGHTLSSGLTPDEIKLLKRLIK